MSEQGPQAGDSVSWTGRMGRVWGLVERVAGDGTLTVQAGAYRNRITKQPDDISAWEPGGSRFARAYPDHDVRHGRRR